ncbi:peroxiredoxin-5, mitochondrial-like [Centruroides sculpturatus]|uniref:peroxiredoxin-5, mitochondrial-like n=1 Tax=Centruroides sculpturatus TaxID=218467 RepID=UPI000C6CF50E|nr:peroxiredoxin-5, mitochondrial-like [Centruroides sculpturatus]
MLINQPVGLLLVRRLNRGIYQTNWKCLRNLSTMPLKVGDSLPSIDLMENTPDSKVNIAELFKNKKGILFAVPGAFTPGCSKTHLPGYVQDYDQLKQKGIDVIACVAVNDPFVMEAWGKDQKAEGKIRMLADTTAEFTKAIGMDVDVTDKLGGIRSKRYSMIIEDGKVKQLCLEPDGFGLTCSLSSNIQKLL